MASEQITLAIFLKSTSLQLTGVSFDSNPCVLIMKEAEFDSWKQEQERILGVRYTLQDRNRAPETSQNRQYLWRDRYVCHRRGKPRSYQTNVTPSKRRRNQKDSIKCGCNAYFLVNKPLQDLEENDEVIIEYHWQHSGHTPANTNHSQYVGLNPQVSDYIRY